MKVSVNIPCASVVPVIVYCPFENVPSPVLVSTTVAPDTGFALASFTVTVIVLPWNIVTGFGVA